MGPDQTTGSSTDAGGASTGTVRPSWQRPALFFSISLVVAGVLAYVLFGGIGSGSRSAAVEPGISKAAATLLQFAPVGGKSSFPATNFTLTDQRGQPTSLAQFRGKSVVLSFNDDRCKDLCTLLAQSIVVADRDLRGARKDVVFLSVNVNPFYPSVSSVKAWTDEHGLGGEPNWYFTTGTPAQLKAVWKRYGTYVRTTTAARTVVHGTQLFFINPAGKMRGVASFGTNAANTSLYAHDMAQAAVDLLPASEQTAIGGPVTKAPTQAVAAVGGKAPSFSLPSLAPGGGVVSLDKYRGRYVVVNFWSSTCTACVPELPHIEAAYRRFAGKVAFVGVDVSDTARRARAFAKKAGVTYPLASNTSGSAAGAYQIPGLPFTALVSPNGTLLVRHPGAMTTEQLEYILETTDPALGKLPAT